MKLNAFTIFLFLLICLVIFHFLCNSQEGFISYLYTTNPNETKVTTMNAYNPSKPVHRLYDNLFVDPTNGNLIEITLATTAQLEGTNTTITPDLTGITVTGLQVTHVNGTTSKSYTSTNAEQIIDDSTLSAVNSTFSWARTNTSTVTQTYNCICIPFEGHVIYHVINLSTNLHVITHVLDTTAKIMKTPVSHSNTFTPGSTTVVSSDTNNNNSQGVKDTAFSSTLNLYQMSPSVKYENSTGTVVIKTSTSAYTLNSIYNASGSAYSTPLQTTSIPNNWTESNIANQTPSAWVIYDTMGQQNVLCVALGLNVTLALFRKVENNIQIDNVQRFKKGSGILGSVTVTGVADTTVGNNAANQYSFTQWPPSPEGLSGDEIAKFYFTYNSLMQGSSSSSGAFDTAFYNSPQHDYILKTQVVPPVSCPSCNCHGTSCSSCGVGAVAGGAATTSSTANSGTTSSTKQPLLELAKETSSLVQDTTQEASSLLRSTGAGTSDLLKTAGGGLSSLLQNSSSGVSNFLKSGGSGASNFLQNSGSGASNFLQNSGSGISNFVQNTNSQVKKNTQGDSNYYTKEQMNQNADFTLMDAVSQGGQKTFMPVTADFSKFTRNG